MINQCHLGDCRDMLPMLADFSVDAIVTDPPYEIGFMGKAWDKSDIAFDVKMWRECLRVLKPGGHLLAFGGSRTYHRLACAIEDAGFEIRDQIQWVFGSGFPKSKNLDGDHDGWGTALKPAHEPIVVARKPLTGTVAANVMAHGTGVLNIDGCRVEGQAPRTTQGQSEQSGEIYGSDQRCQRVFEPHTAGRWPANLIHDGSDEVLELFPVTTSGVFTQRKTTGMWSSGEVSQSVAATGDSGSAARFFYCAKASKQDRDEGLDHHEDRVLARSCQAQAEAARGNMVESEGGAFNKARIRKNNHPTVKPTELMRYLCRLVTPLGGLILDPMAGSGSTGKAAVLEGFQFIGFDKVAEHVEIANARIRYAIQQYLDETRQQGLAI